MAEHAPGHRVSELTLRSIVLAFASVVLLAGCSAEPTASVACSFQPGGERQAESAADSVAEAITEERPEMWVGIVLSSAPTGCPTLYIKGLRDTFIDELLSSAAVPFVVEDDQPFSFDELEERQRRVYEALFEITPQVAIGFDITREGVMEAVVMREEGIDRPTLEAAIPAELRDSVELRLVDTPVVDPQG